MSDYPEWSAISTSTRVRTKTFPRLAEDMPTFLGVPVALSEKDLGKRKGYPCKLINDMS